MIALVVPCFNEATRFNKAYWTEIVESIPDALFIFVNDGSTDETSKVISSLKNEQCFFLNSPTNLGKGEAIRLGLNFALQKFKPHSLGFIDSDGAFGPVDIRNLIAAANDKFSPPSKITCLISSRVALSGRKIERSKFRHYMGRIIVSYVCLGWNHPPYDTQSGFKIFKSEPDFVEAITTKFATRWFFDIEILLRISRDRSDKVWEVPLESWCEIGNSSINLREFGRVAREIRTIRKLVNSEKKQVWYGSN